MQSHPLPTPVLIVLLPICVLAGIFYLLTLQKALKRCAPASRTTKPGKVWLAIIPLFGFVWQFVIVMNIAKSLRNQFTRLGIPCPNAALGENVGLVACVCSCCTYLYPEDFASFSFLARPRSDSRLFSWIAYWVRIANDSRLLEEYQATAPASPIV